MAKPSTPPIQRFRAKVRRADGGCWEWTGSGNGKGYGVFYSMGVPKRMLAHRWSYEHFVGPIPDGMVIDHLCRNRGCVNPEHLEAVTPEENRRRGLKGVLAPTHCPRGHLYDDVNLYVSARGHRHCRPCNTEKQRARRARG